MLFSGCRKAVGKTLFLFVSFEKSFQKGSGFFYPSFGFFVCPAFMADGEASSGMKTSFFGLIIYGYYKPYMVYIKSRE
ncbi:hypothetical protein BRW84_07690 [Oxalobacter formigenes OXCC13]|nr:hypothetical protein BRW84_07690 [Oxalobacter formigenes OXCC13]